VLAAAAEQQEGQEGQGLAATVVAESSREGNSRGTGRELGDMLLQLRHSTVSTSLQPQHVAEAGMRAAALPGLCVRTTELSAVAHQQPLQKRLVMHIICRCEVMYSPY
jgi:hypothetical protein